MDHGMKAQVQTCAFRRSVAFGREQVRPSAQEWQIRRDSRSLGSRRLLQLRKQLLVERDDLPGLLVLRGRQQNVGGDDGLRVGATAGGEGIVETPQEQSSAPTITAS